MSRCAPGLLAIVAAICAGCGKPSPTPGAGTAAPPASAPAPAAPAPASTPDCDALPFAASTPVPEASGAGWLTVDGKLVLVVLGDSGNHGAYGLIDPDTGATRETGLLPLSAPGGIQASDDIEGVAVVGDRLYGLTSAGWIRVWRRDGTGFALVEPPYSIGPVDLPDTRNNSRPPRGDGMVCSARAGNCGRNYEGLCLAPVPPTAPGACVGFAASKADGHLYCLTDDHGKLVVHRDRAIEVARPGALADCAFDDAGRLWLGSNLFDLGNVYQVTGWDDPAHAQVTRVGVLSVGFPEVIAVRGDVVYRMSDLGGAPSLMARYRCRPAPR